MRPPGGGATRFVMARLAWVAAALTALSGCRSVPEERPAPSPSAAASASAPHDDHEQCSHDVAHPAHPRQPVATATALSAEARGKVTTLRVMAHSGAAIIRKDGAAWKIGGTECEVDTARIDRALDNLTTLVASPTSDRPAGAAAFELQIVVQSGEERVLHFDVAHRAGGKDLVQLADDSGFWISGLDRQLWTADPRVWCAPRH